MREGTAEQDRRERDLERKLEAGKKARDIGPIPAVADPERRERCSATFQGFCETYFADAFSLGWSDDHLRVLGKIEQVLTVGGLFGFGMPRGSGKTTLCRAAVLDALLYGRHPYVVLIASAEDMARSLLDSIKRVLLGNPLLAEDFPEVVAPIRALENNARKQVGQLCEGQPTYITWAADKLVLPTIPKSAASGSIITVAGLDSSMRGQQHTRMDGTVIRPSLVVLDDPQTRQSAGSVTQTRRRLATLYGDVLGMAGPGKKISGFMPCTKIYHDDLADQVLDPERTPEFQGECTKLVYEFPAADDLWEQYAKLRADGLRAGDAGREATAFYNANRKAMDKGARVAWADRFNDDELSAIQHAMNLKLRDEEAFFAEYQNEPVADQDEDLVVTAEQIMQRTNGRPRKEAPASTAHLTAFIDVQEKALYYVVAAWEPGFTGVVADYGTFPDQKRRYFTLRDAKRTLKRTYQGAGTEGAIQAGLEQLGGELLDQAWPVAGAGGQQTLRIERLLVDAGYLPQVVGAACRQLGSAAMPSKGVGIKAGQRPMTAYRRRPGERHGWHWYVPSIARTAEVRHVLYDTNHWKAFVHARLGTMPGDRGALTLWGKSPTTHKMLADHVGSAETCIRTEGFGRVVNEWNHKPSNPDNHLFDCLVGAAVAGSMAGASLGEQAGNGRSSGGKVKLSELQRKRAA